MLKETYNKNKYKYTFLKHIVDAHSSHIEPPFESMQGGAKKKKRKNIFEEPFSLPKNAKQTIKLPTPKHIKKIGDLMINREVVIGDCYWRKIGLKSGVYEAYRVDDNLMIIHKDLKIKPNKNIKTWTWKNSGTGVDVESGSFGFFDLTTIKKLLKRIKKPKFHRMPRIDRMLNGLDEIGADKFSLGTLIKANIKNDEAIYGVMATTDIGDGGFQCFIIDDNRAILIGGLTGDRLGLWSDSDNF